ncbi:hypothetical protein BYT27DRAFT_7259938 [Phlegmacium glaucopus]|nr:hypothetical protein BYT27DRAFT_7259938 [Phlegmacium glaucopus]
MLTSQGGCGAHVKIPMTKLTTDNIVKPILSSHCENIAAAEACKLPPTPLTSHLASSSSSATTTTTGPPPTAPSTVDAQPPPQALTLILAPTKCSFRTTVVNNNDMCLKIARTAGNCE